MRWKKAQRPESQETAYGLFLATLQDIAAAWKGLEAGEKEKQEFLQNDLIRLERLEHLAATFERKASMLEKWVTGQDAALQNNDDIAAADLPEANVSLVSFVCMIVCTIEGEDLVHGM